MTDGLGPLLGGFFDAAALFPPQSATMSAAVAEYKEARASGAARLLGPFVCPGERIAGLAAAIDEHRVGSIPVALTFPGGLEDDVESALSIAGAVSKIEVVAIELPLLDASPSEVTEVARSVPRTFVEVPCDEVNAAILGELRDAGLFLKLRTGGQVARAFPTEESLAGAIVAAVNAEVAFKCTAGLHNAVRHRDDVTGFEHHGFLNLILAVARAISGCELGDVVTTLGIEGSDVIAKEIQALGTDELTAVRERFLSIGTCSLAEPVADLRSLGVGLP